MATLLIAGKSTYVIDKIIKEASESFERVEFLTESDFFLSNKYKSYSDEIYCLSSWTIPKFSVDKSGDEEINKLLFKYKGLLGFLEQINIKKLVHLGSYWEGLQVETPFSNYIESKREISKLLENHSSKIPNIVIELTDLIGVDDPRPKLIPKMVNSLLTRRPLDILYPSNIFVPLEVNFASHKILQILLDNNLTKKRTMLHMSEIYSVKKIIDLFESTVGKFEKTFSLGIDSRNYKENDFSEKFGFGVDADSNTVMFEFFNSLNIYLKSSRDLR